MDIYHDLAPWYRMLDPCDDHREECEYIRDALRHAVHPAPRTLLELGAGAGNNAFHLKRHFTCTLTDVSEPMLSHSREINPECEHVLGDMRSLRLGRTFDVVLVHDAVVYMTTEQDLAAAAATAYAHTRPGGACVFAPDCLRETFVDSTDDHEGEDGERAMRCLAWSWDPGPSDDTYVVDYVFLLREGTEMRVVHERHVEGLFSAAVWRRILSEAGYRVESLARPLPEEEADGPYTDSVFLCHRDPDGSAG